MCLLVCLFIGTDLDPVILLIFFLAKAQKEAYEKKEKEKAKLSRTSVRH